MTSALNHRSGLVSFPVLPLVAGDAAEFRRAAGIVRASPDLPDEAGYIRSRLRDAAPQCGAASFPHTSFSRSSRPQPERYERYRSGFFL
jgi:hypothetical protein